MSTKTKVKIDYVEMWHDDKNCVIKTMVRNMNADMQAGYDWLSMAIQEQLATITTYTVEYKKQSRALEFMTNNDAQKWCKRDLIRSGTIE